MGELNVDPTLGNVLFRCRPNSLRTFFSLRDQGPFPPFKWVRRLGPFMAITSAVAESIVLGGIPTVLLIFVFEVLFGLKPPHQPGWVRPVCFVTLFISLPVSLWWYWIAPRKDSVTVCEWGFSWRISHAHWGWFRSHGHVVLSELEAFTWRSDCLAPEAVDWGTTTADKLGRIWLELSLSRRSVAFHLKGERTIVAEELFSRFHPEDVRRFLDHLAAFAEPNCFKV